MGVKDRILQFVQNEGISVRKFCEKNSFSHSIFTIKGGINSDKLSKIIDNYPHINMDWVISGRGEMYYPLSNLSSNSLEKLISIEVENHLKKEQVDMDDFRNLSKLKTKNMPNYSRENFNALIKFLKIDVEKFAKKFGINPVDLEFKMDNTPIGDKILQKFCKPLGFSVNDFNNIKNYVLNADKTDLIKYFSDEDISNEITKQGLARNDSARNNELIQKK